MSRFFGTSAEVWMGLQSEYELDCIIYEERSKGESKFDFIERFIPKVAAMI